MKRRFNYTGRKRIPKEKISIILNRDNAITSFTATIDLSDMSLLTDAKVYMEAYHKTEVKRYDFGTVANTVKPEDTRLTGLSYTENLKFRVLVVDESKGHGLILAHADRARPEGDVDRKSILPVEFRDIGQQIWRIDFAGDEEAPVLVLNNRIPNIETIARSDSQFFMHVYPCVIREVLRHMVFVDGVDSPSDPNVEWHGEWLGFAKRILPNENPPNILAPKEESFEGEEAEKWINGVVEEFCSSRKEWNEYINQLTGEVEK